jgi:hypothetical protein
MKGMTVYAAITRTEGGKQVLNRKGTVVEVVKMGRSYIVKWDDKDQPDAQPWLTSNLSFTAPPKDE